MTNRFEADKPRSVPVRDPGCSEAEISQMAVRSSFLNVNPRPSAHDIITWVGERLERYGPNPVEARADDHKRLLLLCVVAYKQSPFRIVSVQGPGMVFEVFWDNLSDGAVSQI